MRIPARYCGPPTSANGGVTAGRLAAYVGAPVVQVTLRRPPPLDTDLRVDQSGGTARLYDGELLVAEAVPAELDVAPPGPVPVEAAREAMTRYAGLRSHPFPTCWVCGPDREPPDGLGVRPGPVGEGRSATTWVPVDDDPVQVWAALDCPGGWATDLEGRPMVLGRTALRRDGAVTPGAEHVVVGEVLGEDGRKTRTATALYGPDGALLAVAQATWVAVAV